MLYESKHLIKTQILIKDITVAYSWTYMLINIHKLYTYMIYLYIYLIFNSFLYASFVKIFVNYKRNYIQCEKYTKNYVIKRKKQNVVCYAAFTIYEFYIYILLSTWSSFSLLLLLFLWLSSHFIWFSVVAYYL